MVMFMAFKKKSKPVEQKIEKKPLKSSHSVRSFRTQGPKRLYRSGKDKLVGGVCGGIAEYLEVDPVLIRLIWAVAVFLLYGTGVLLYIIAWIIIPRNPEHKWD